MTENDRTYTRIRVYEEKTLALLADTDVAHVPRVGEYVITSWNLNVGEIHNSETRTRRVVNE